MLNKMESEAGDSKQMEKSVKRTKKAFHVANKNRAKAVQNANAQAKLMDAKYIDRQEQEAQVQSAMENLEQSNQAFEQAHSEFEAELLSLKKKLQSDKQSKVYIGLLKQNLNRLLEERSLVKKSAPETEQVVAAPKQEQAAESVKETPVAPIVPVPESVEQKQEQQQETNEADNNVIVNIKNEDDNSEDSDAPLQIAIIVKKIRKANKRKATMMKQSKALKRLAKSYASKKNSKMHKAMVKQHKINTKLILNIYNKVNKYKKQLKKMTRI